MAIVVVVAADVRVGAVTSGAGVVYGDGGGA